MSTNDNTSKTPNTMKNGQYNKVSEREYEYMCNDKLYTLIVGKNKKDNWRIIDEAGQDDIWFHAEDRSSAHVIIQITEENKMKKLDKKLKKFAGILVKRHTKISDSTKTNVIFTEIKNLVKGKDVGSVISSNTKRIVV